MKTVKVKNIKIGENTPKICVSITGKNKKQVLIEGGKIKELRADIIEWRIDYYEEVNKIDSVINLLNELRNVIGEIPLIFTLRSKREGGQNKVDLSYYKKLYTDIVETNLVDIIDIESNLYDEEINKIISYAKQLNIKVIISNHEFSYTPTKEDLINKIIDMQNQGADICKLAVMPKDKIDVIRLLEVTEIMNKKCDIPLVTISMGEKGMISRLSGQIFGSCLTFACADKESAPGQIKIEELRKVIEIIDNNISKNKIFLIGFMGVGKTTISSKLSLLLNMKEIDIDKYIENNEQMIINEIFNKYGEDYFRKLETDTLIDLQKEDNIIVSCGGGIVLKDENIEIMKKQGFTILLEANSKTIYNRLKNCTNRPILKGNIDEDFIIGLKEKRKDSYYKAADIIIHTDDKSIKEICEEILIKIDFNKI